MKHHNGLMMGGNCLYKKSSQNCKEITLLHSSPNIYSDVVATINEQLGCTNIFSDKIDTGMELQFVSRLDVFLCPRESTGAVKRYDAKKVISLSKNPWVSPVVLVTKKDGFTKFCIDYRKVNEVTRKDV